MVLMRRAWTPAMSSRPDSTSCFLISPQELRPLVPAEHDDVSEVEPFAIDHPKHEVAHSLGQAGSLGDFDLLQLDAVGTNKPWRSTLISEEPAGECCNLPRVAKVDPASITLNGKRIDPAASYRVTVNSFLASGGDGFAVLTEGKDPLTGVIDVDAFDAYLRANNPLTPPALGRITRLP